MKILKKIIATTLALLITGTFLFGANAGKVIVENNVAYAASAVDSQRDQLRLAINDATYVRGTQSYKNAARKDVDIYEATVIYGQNLLNKTSATGQELHQATKDIDNAAKYLPTSANIIIIKGSVEKLDNKVAGFEFVKQKMPSIYKKFKNEIDSFIKDSKIVIEEMNQYIAKNER